MVLLFIRQPVANPRAMAYSATFLFNTGRLPGMPVQTGQVWVLGSAPNFVEQPQKIFVLVESSMCTSKPMTVSYCFAAILHTCLSLVCGLLSRHREISPQRFISLSHRKQRLFAKSVSDKLYTNRQTIFIQTAWHT